MGKENRLMKTKKRKRGLSFLLAVLAAAVCLLTGCGTQKSEAQEDAETIQVYLWNTTLYEKYAPYIQSQLPDVNIEFIVGNNNLDFYKFLNENGGLPDIITCCRFSLHDAAPLKDIQMPIMDGYAAARAIRALPDAEKAGLPIVAMTANAFDEDRQNAEKAGMNGHLSKPFDMQQLLTMLREKLAP